MLRYFTTQSCIQTTSLSWPRSHELLNTIIKPELQKMLKLVQSFMLLIFSGNEFQNLHAITVNYLINITVVCFGVSNKDNNEMR